MIANNDIAAIFSAALSAFNGRDIKKAEEGFRQVLRLDASHVPALNLLTVVLMGSRRFAEAEPFISRAVKLNQNSDVSFYNYGLIAQQLNKPQLAYKQFSNALRLNPNVQETWNNRGTALNALEKYEAAISDFNKAIELNSKYAEAYANKAKSLFQLKRYNEALPAYDKALTIKPNLSEAWFGCGNVFADLKRYNEALSAYDSALAVKSDLEGAWLGRGNVLWSLKRYDEALAAYDKALARKPDLENAWLGRGNVFYDLKRYDEAVVAYDKALVINPDLANAWLGRGNVFWKLKRYNEALAAYGKALAIKPDLENAWLGRGNVFNDLKRYDEAMAAYDKALAIKPDLEYAWLGRGNVFNDLKRHDEAFAAYDRAWALNGDLVAEGARLYSKLHCCAWSDLAEDTASLIDSIRSGEDAPAPFVTLSIDASPEDQLRCADTWVRKNVGGTEHQGVAAATFDKADKIRVGYLSADFRTHPVGYLIAGLFECHDSDRFETYAFSIGPNDNSDLRNRIEKSFYKFVDLNNRSDDEISSVIKSAKIDILVDLMGHTYGARLSVLARRPAPILVSYLGFAGTVGGDLLDYIIVDKVVVPNDNRKYFSEKMAFLPHCFMPHDDRGRIISDRSFTRQDQQLPEQGFVFCSFNNSYKINPGIFNCWMNILKNVDGSVLWLSNLEAVAKKNLRKEAEERRVDPDRLVFSERLASPADHLARHRLADLFLDTLPYNAHTTASDALWGGLPVLTQIGGSFAGRVAASLLNAIGLPELVTQSRKEYEALAIELALDREKLQNVRKKLHQNRLATPLFDMPLYTKHIESAYEAIYQRYKSGLPPDHIEIQAIKST